MVLFKKSSLAALLLAGVAGQALAADLPEPPIVEAPPPAVDYAPAPAPAFGGWYIRGDADYHWNDFRGAKYDTYSTNGHLDEHDEGYGDLDVSHDGELKGDLDEAWSLGGGVGYQITDYLRADLTADYFAKADFEGYTEGYCGHEPCTSSDHAELSTWLLLANAYVELGTYGGFTPYAGAGIGGAHVKWDKLENSVDHETTEHDGHKEWRFAYAFMAGASYCLTRNLDLDVGYRFSRIHGGKMFDYARGESGYGGDIGAGPGYDKGFNVHEVRAGLRYNFGDKNAYRDGCGEPQPVAYEPPPPVEPVYK